MKGVPLLISLLLLIILVSGMSWFVSCTPKYEYRLCFDGEKYKIQEKSSLFPIVWDDMTEGELGIFSCSFVDTKYFWDKESALLILKDLREEEKDRQWKKDNLKWKCCGEIEEK